MPLVLIAACTAIDEPKSLNVEQVTTEPGPYIVVLSKPVIKSTAARLLSAGESDLSMRNVVVSAMSSIADTYDTGPAEKVFSNVIRGGVYNLDSNQVVALRNDPRVAYVEHDGVVSISAIQTSAPWGLDRLDQLSLPLDRKFLSPASATVVNAYVIDTGINFKHVEFQGRAVHGFDAVDHDQDAVDCNGHGTHVAGTIGSTTYGVAKNVRLTAVRVLDCEGSGTFSGVIEGIEWVTKNHTKPAVANMSLGGGVSQAIDDAVKASVLAGVTYVVAAGNNSQDACSSSPARAPLAITVGSTTMQDARSSFSNFGSCVDIFAPGSDILSTWFNSNTATNTISGTSMASPHVAGAAALYLAQHPNAQPQDVAVQLVAQAVAGKISGAGVASPNLLLNLSFLNSGGGAPIPTPLPVDETGVVRLKNGIAQTALSGAKGEELFFVVELPIGTKNLSVEISGGNGDADLYVRRGSKPTGSVYDCRPFTSGNRESCTATGSEKVYVRIHGFSAFSGLQVVARF